MNVEFLSKFSKDLDKFNQPHTKIAVRNLKLAVEQAASLSEIANIKTLKKVLHTPTVSDWAITESVFLYKRTPYNSPELPTEGISTTYSPDYSQSTVHKSTSVNHSFSYITAHVLCNT